MYRKSNILRNITTLKRFEPMTPRKIYYINCLTKSDTITELINLVKQKMEFIMETKYNNNIGCPKLIQILFTHRLTLHIILVETLYLPELGSCLHHQIQSLFSHILSPSKEIQSWSNIKSDLSFFLKCLIFTKCQIENIQAINIKDKFEGWFEEKFNNIKVEYIPSGDWPLDEVFAFLFQKYFDTSLSKSFDWNIGLFAHFKTECDPDVVRSNSTVVRILKDNERRLILRNYAIDECIAVKKIAGVVLYSWTQKHAENRLAKYYGTYQDSQK